jgi:AraC-like DNA-binding protein
MKRGGDIAVRFPGLFLVHHNRPGGDVAAHAHPEHHLIIPLQGEIRVELAGEALVCGPGRMAYVAPDTPHVFKSARDKGERLICMVDAEFGAFASRVLPASQLCKEILFHLLLNKETKSAKALIGALVQTTAEMLAAPAAGGFDLEHAESAVKRPELKKALALAREKFAEDLSVAAMAKKSGVSERNLSRLMREELGLSPKALLVALRMEKAKEILALGESVTEAAFAVGYSSLSQFIASFRAHTGQLPSEYGRKRQ